MKNGQNPQQQKEIEYIESTYGEPKIVRAVDMAIIRQPTFFPGTNLQRSFRNARDSSIGVISELDFLCEHLPKRYKHQILRSDEFDQFLNNIFDVEESAITKQDVEEKDLALNLATQMMLNSLEAIIRSMPHEFQKPLTDSAIPFINQLQALSTYSDRKEVTNIPKIRIPDKFFKNP